MQVGKHWRKLKELSGTRLTDAENVLVMRILTDVVRDGLVRQIWGGTRVAVILFDCTARNLVCEGKSETGGPGPL